MKTNVPTHRCNGIKTNTDGFAKPFGKMQMIRRTRYLYIPFGLQAMQKRQCLWNRMSCLRWICLVDSLMPKSIAKSVPHKYFTFVYVYGQRPLKCYFCHCCGRCCCCCSCYCVGTASQFTIRGNCVPRNYGLRPLPLEYRPFKPLYPLSHIYFPAFLYFSAGKHFHDSLNHSNNSANKSSDMLSIVTFHLK